MFVSSVAAGLALAAVARAAVLVNFQVAAPPNVPNGAKTCEVTVVDHTFGASYYQPSVVDYVPPTECGAVGSWAAVTLNLTVTSNGTQFDRLAILGLNDTEIWRTSTSEPTRDGIIWTYVKDVTQYIPLFSGPSEFKMELNNVLDNRYTGLFATKVTATFYASSPAYAPAPKADLILPVGVVTTEGGAEASVPPTFSKNVTFPKNSVAVYAELFASGNGQEEFWYFNTATKYIDQLPDGFAYPTGPFREVQLLVDGKLAGFAYPYATIFTGGIVPTAWRPIAAYGAYDLPTYHVDLTPFVPLLADGLPHNISISVASAEDDHATLPNWYVSANLKVVTDPSGKPTTGKMTTYSAPAYGDSSASASKGSGSDVNITVTSKHSLRIESTVTSGSGKTTKVVFTQNMQFSNTQAFLNDFNSQIVTQKATGSVLSLHNGQTVVSDVFSYPLTIDYENLNENGTEWTTIFNHSYTRDVLPAPFILGSTTKEHQYATGYFKSASTGNSGNGTSDNTISYVDTKGGTYNRAVSASLNNITSNKESGSLSRQSLWGWLEGAAPKGKAAQSAFTHVRLPAGRTY